MSTRIGDAMLDNGLSSGNPCHCAISRGTHEIQGMSRDQKTAFMQQAVLAGWSHTLTNEVKRIRCASITPPSLIVVVRVVTQRNAATFDPRLVICLPPPTLPALRSTFQSNWRSCWRVKCDFYDLIDECTICGHFHCHLVAHLCVQSCIGFFCLGQGWPG